MWQQFITLAHKCNHTVICVTLRYDYENEDMCKVLQDRLRVIYTGRQAKREFVKNLGIWIDVWVDDTPDFIVGDYVLIGK
jgi:hypothetical protein